MRKLILSFLIILISCISADASTTITAQVIRNQAGSGETLISSGFPCPPGLVTEAMVTGGLIKVLVEGSEVAANVTGLRGRHSDGTLRSVLIQFTLPSMAQNEVLSAQVVIDGGARGSVDPVYIRPTKTIVTNNNVILATSPAYLASTEVTFQKLLPAGQGSTAEQKLYGDGNDSASDWADDWFDRSVANATFTLSPGGAQYEPMRAMIASWVKTGKTKFFNHAIAYTFSVLYYDTAEPDGALCNETDEVTNPDDRTDYQACGVAGEPYLPSKYSYATMYLLTGYRDFWGIVAASVQKQQTGITDQATADSSVIAASSYDSFRYNYGRKYNALIPALLIDATIPVSGNGATGRVMSFRDQLSWTLQALKNKKWDFVWVPYNSGTGNVPAQYSQISQGAATGTLLGVYQWKQDPQRWPGQLMPETGWLMVKVTSGSFSSGAITGVGATATGAQETDYRNGIVGVLANGLRRPNVGVAFTGSISGTTLTVSNNNGLTITPGDIIEFSGFTLGTYIVSKNSDSPEVYTISNSANFTGSIYIGTLLPNFQLTFPANFLMDYYLNVDQDADIPNIVKAHIDTLLTNIQPLVAGDGGYATYTGVWGKAENSYTPTHGIPYPLRNPVDTGKANSWELPEYTRMIAFVLKTVPGAGELVINGKSYAEWYEICIDTANISPINNLTSYVWKTYGQMLGFNSDTPWIMAQSSLPAPSFRAPTNYATIPGDIPDLGRSQQVGKRYRNARAVWQE